MTPLKQVWHRVTGVSNLMLPLRRREREIDTARPDITKMNSDSSLKPSVEHEMLSNCDGSSEIILSRKRRVESLGDERIHPIIILTTNTSSIKPYKRLTFSLLFKMQAIQRYDEYASTSSKRVLSDVARQLGIHQDTLRNWLLKRNEIVRAYGFSI